MTRFGNAPSRLVYFGPARVAESVLSSSLVLDGLKVDSSQLVPIPKPDRIRRLVGEFNFGLRSTERGDIVRRQHNLGSSIPRPN